MKIKKLIGEELSNSIQEIRESLDNYEELVFFSKDISNWSRILTEKIGPPLISAEGMKIEGSSEEISASKKEAVLNLANSLGVFAQARLSTMAYMIRPRL